MGNGCKCLESKNFAEQERRYESSDRPERTLVGEKEPHEEYEMLMKDLKQQRTLFERQRSTYYYVRNLESKKFDYTEKLYLDFIKRNPDNPDALYHYACFLLEKMRVEECQAYLKRCLEINDTCGKYHRKYSELLDLMGKVQASQDHLQKAYEYGIEQSSAHGQRGQIGQIVEENDVQKAQVEEETENCCVICLNNQSTHISKNCGHFCLCQICTELINKKCPICNQVGSFIKVYPISSPL